jgi:oxygen-dependent protoporphyrinogen oxidase
LRIVERRIVVIGGGISGLAAAHRILERIETARHSDDAPHTRIEVLLLESSHRLGGTIHTHRHQGFLLEGGPDSFITEKPAAVELAKRLGIENHLIDTNESHRRSFVVRGGRLRPTPEGFQLLAPSRLWPFVTSSIFSWRGKARMALDLVLPRRAMSHGIDDESLADFVRRRLGNEALQRMAQPMVGGIYTADPEHLSLRSTMPRFLDMEEEHRSLILAMWRASRLARANGSREEGTSGARYGMFLSFDGGMQTLTDAIVERLPLEWMQTKVMVEGLEFAATSGKWVVKTADGGAIIADGVCVALPAYAAANVLASVDAALASELEAIPYASTATVNLAYTRDQIPHALDGFGFVVPFVEKRTILACTFSSVKFAGRAPDRCALLRAFVGGALQPENFELDEELIIDKVCRDLRDLMGIEAPPLFAQVEKWPRSMAQYHIGHMERLESIRARLRNFPTLRLAGNAYEGAGIPNCISSGETAADELLQALMPAK